MLNDWYDIGIPERIVEVRSVLRCKCSKLGSQFAQSEWAILQGLPLAHKRPVNLPLSFLCIYWVCGSLAGKIGDAFFEEKKFWEGFFGALEKAIFLRWFQLLCTEKTFVATVAPRLEYTRVTRSMNFAHVFLFTQCIDTWWQSVSKRNRHRTTWRKKLAKNLSIVVLECHRPYLKCLKLTHSLLL